MPTSYFDAAENCLRCVNEEWAFRNTESFCLSLSVLTTSEDKVTAWVQKGEVTHPLEMLLLLFRFSCCWKVRPSCCQAYTYCWEFIYTLKNCNPGQKNNKTTACKKSWQENKKTKATLIFSANDVATDVCLPFPIPNLLQFLFFGILFWKLLPVFTNRSIFHSWRLFWCFFFHVVHSEADRLVGEGSG